MEIHLTQTTDEIVDHWRNIIVGDRKSWVVFKHGTCVVILDSTADPAEAATAILKEWGPVHAGSSYGDFSVRNLTNYPGWLVLYHHPDILTYVDPAELPDPNPPPAMIGIHGRAKRRADAAQPQVIHVEDRRSTPGIGSEARVDWPAKDSSESEPSSEIAEKRLLLLLQQQYPQRFKTGKRRRPLGQYTFTRSIPARDLLVNEQRGKSRDELRRALGKEDPMSPLRIHSFETPDSMVVALTNKAIDRLVAVSYLPRASRRPG